MDSFLGICAQHHTKNIIAWLHPHKEWEESDVKVLFGLATGPAMVDADTVAIPFLVCLHCALGSYMGCITPFLRS